MGQLLRLPVDETAFARLTDLQRQRHEAEDRAEWVRKARATMRQPEHQPAQVLRDACAVLQAWGDGSDYLEADAMIFALNRRERMHRHDAAREVSAKIAMRHRPQLLAVGAGCALAGLAVVAFNVWVAL